MVCISSILRCFPIRISKRIEEADGTIFSYGYIYSIKETSTEEKIAVNIKNKYYVAVNTME